MSGFYTWRLDDPDDVQQGTSMSNARRSNSRSRRRQSAAGTPSSSASTSSPSTPFNITPGWSTASPAFGPTFEVSGSLPDLSIVTGDRLCYYAHTRFLLHSSSNGFGGLLTSTPPPRTIDVPEAGAALQVALHAIYRMPCTHLGASLESTEGAVDALFKYGVDAGALATPHSPLFQLVLAHAPATPIEAYAFAGHFDMEPLAVAVSAHLLSFDTSRITDALARQMGPLYFKRLLDFHQARLASLKDIVLSTPKSHEPRTACRGGKEGPMAKAWAFAAAGIVWEAAPGISTYQLRSAFEKAAANIACDECLTMLQGRIEEVVQEWSAVKRMI